MSNLLLTNYEASKLNVGFPTMTNVAILLFIAIISILWTRKKTTTFLDRSQTDQLRGGSILLVIITHLWQHVSSIEASPHLSGYGVFVFLLISGFALTSTLGKKTFTWNRFLSRRLKRMMVPYWFFTPVWLIGDYFLLHRTYSLHDIAYTMVGVNFHAISNIDYVRWYITWIIMWYVAFAVTNRVFTKFGAMLCLFAFGGLLLVLRVMDAIPLVSHPAQMLAFPLGMLLAIYRENVTDWLTAREGRSTVIFGTASLLLLVSGLALLSITNTTGSKAAVSTFLSSAQVAWCVVFVMAVALLGRYGYVSRFLESWGKVSYSAFLIHGPLLIKYNPIMGLFPDYAVVISFPLFLVLVWVLAYLVHSSFERMWIWVDELSKPSERPGVLDSQELKVKSAEWS